MIKILLKITKTSAFKKIKKTYLQTLTCTTFDFQSVLWSHFTEK